MRAQIATQFALDLCKAPLEHSLPRSRGPQHTARRPIVTTIDGMLGLAFLFFL